MISYFKALPNVIRRAVPFQEQAGSARERLSSIGQLFELEGRDRLLPMEGMRGVAVSLVFLQHYCFQFVAAGNLGGATARFAAAFRNYGNNGVELFFVLSGFLIYGILLKKKPRFLRFMGRRAQRLYPTFLVSLLIACFIDLLRPHPYIPEGFLPAARYLAENLMFLPGLFPITPISAVNWSLSYEWWFYALCTALFVTFGLSRAPAKLRVVTIIGIALGIVGLEAYGTRNVPIRGLSLLAGMLLAECELAHVRPVSNWVAVVAVALSFGISVSGYFSAPIVSIALAAAFFALCSSAFFRGGYIGSLFSATPIRRLGNMSYSFYLVHGFAVVAILSPLLHIVPAGEQNAAFWLAMAPIFLVALCCAGVLFLSVERPFSLRVRVSSRVSATAGTILQ